MSAGPKIKTCIEENTNEVVHMEAEIEESTFSPSSAAALEDV
jgi:hypothetical protein